MGKVYSKEEHLESVFVTENGRRTESTVEISNAPFSPNATSTPFSRTSLQRRPSRRARTPVSFDLSEIKKVDEKVESYTGERSSSIYNKAPASSSENSNRLYNSAYGKSWDTVDIVANGVKNLAIDLEASTTTNEPQSARSEPSCGTGNERVKKRPRSVSLDLLPKNNATDAAIDFPDGKAIPDAIEMRNNVNLQQVMSPDDPRIFVEAGVMSVPRGSPDGMAPNRLKVLEPKDPETSSSPTCAPKYERMHSGRMPVAYFEEDDHPDISLRRKAPYQIRDMILTVWSILSYLWDYVTDWIVAAAFYRDEDYWWFGLTVGFIVVPHLVMSSFSLAWYVQDYRHHPSERPVNIKQWLFRIIILILQLAPVLRYIDSLRFGYLFRRSQLVNRHEFYESLCFENADAAMLRLFEAFMEAAPQLVLQIYILTRKRTDFKSFDFVQLMQIISIFASWFSLATAMASFHRAQRFSQHPKKGMSVLGTVMQFFWHLFIFGSRVVAIALFTAQFGFWGPVVCAVHVIFMITWVFGMKTDFCPNRFLEYLYNIAIGCLYLFAFLNVKDTPTKWKYVFYYTLYYLENIVLISVWFVNTPPYIHWFREPALAMVVGSFLIGIFCFMLPYYYWFHPDKGKIIRKRQYNTEAAAENQPKWLKNLLDFCL